MKHWSLARQRPLLLQQNLLTASKHPMIPYLVVASCVSFVSVSSNILMSTSMTPISTVNFKTIAVISVISPSGSTAASSALCFHISRKLWSVRFWWWEFSNSKMSAAFYVQICVLNLDIMSESTLCKRELTLSQHNVSQQITISNSLYTFQYITLRCVCTLGHILYRKWMSVFTTTDKLPNYMCLDYTLVNVLSFIYDQL